MRVKIPANRPYCPSPEKYLRYVRPAFESGWLTNNGPLAQELTERLCEHLGVQHLLLVANGTMALQVAYMALGVKGRALTTPFTFAATSTSLIWAGIEPRYCDIDACTWNIKSQHVANAVNSEDISAIVPVHVFGNPCSQELEEVANLNGIPLIFDAAHAFGVTVDGASVLNWGNASCLSFHATKIFHTVEGGAIVFRKADDIEFAGELINFGLSEKTPGILTAAGTNAKMSEFHAAMGLAMMDVIDQVISHRSALVEMYRDRLKNVVQIQHWPDGIKLNGSYMPIALRSEAELDKVTTALDKAGVGYRRYFWPSLSRAGWVAKPLPKTAVADSLANRILCLPVFAGLTEDEVMSVCNVIEGIL